MYTEAKIRLRVQIKSVKFLLRSAPSYITELFAHILQSNTIDGIYVRTV